jgi:hypothetical protein
MNRRHHRSGDKTAVGERQKVKTVVNQVELIGPIENCADMQAFPDLYIYPRALAIAASQDGDEFGRGLRVAGGEQRDVDTSVHEALGEKGYELLPWPIVPRWHPPGDWGEHGYLEGHAEAPCHWARRASSKPGKGTRAKAVALSPWA